MKETLLLDRFNTWWENEGQFEIETIDDMKRCNKILFDATKTAWLNGAYVQEEYYKGELDEMDLY